MAIDLETNAPPPPPPPPAEKFDFPGKLCLLAVLLLAGFYYFLIFVVPGRDAEGAGPAARCVDWLGRLAEAHYLLAGSLCLALLAPAVAYRDRARAYLLRLSLLLTLVWGAAWTFTARPEEQAAEAMRSILSSERPMPETIRGR